MVSTAKIWLHLSAESIGSVEEITVSGFTFLDLVLINKWILLAEEAFKLILEEVLH